MSYAPMGPELSKWPKVIGIIAIIFGAGGTIGGLCGAFSFFFVDAMSNLLNNMPGATANPGLDSLQEHKTYTLISSFATLGIACLLLFGGIVLLGRKQKALTMLRVWAAARIALAVVQSAMGYVMNKEQMQTMANSGNPMPLGFTETFFIIGLVIGLAWAFALPVFLLIWFARDKIHRETAEWA
jgi:F0F1-type ATP synthase membrane subunit c/vacuolar-type H+-ATPase subunit K